MTRWPWSCPDPLCGDTHEHKHEHRCSEDTCGWSPCDGRTVPITLGDGDTGPVDGEGRCPCDWHD